MGELVRGWVCGFPDKGICDHWLNYWEKQISQKIDFFGNVFLKGKMCCEIVPSSNFFANMGGVKLLFPPLSGIRWGEFVTTPPTGNASRGERWRIKNGMNERGHKRKKHGWRCPRLTSTSVRPMLRSKSVGAPLVFNCASLVLHQRSVGVPIVIAKCSRYCSGAFQRLQCFHYVYE